MVSSLGQVEKKKSTILRLYLKHVCTVLSELRFDTLFLINNHCIVKMYYLKFNALEMGQKQQVEFQNIS